MICAPCTAVKTLPDCFETLVIGEAPAANTDYSVYLLDNTTGRTVRFDATSDSSAKLSITVDQRIAVNHSYELWVTLKDAPIEDKEEILTPDDNETYLCFAVRFQSVYTSSGKATTPEAILQTLNSNPLLSDMAYKIAQLQKTLPLAGSTVEWSASAPKDYSIVGIWIDTTGTGPEKDFRYEEILSGAAKIRIGGLPSSNVNSNDKDVLHEMFPYWDINTPIPVLAGTTFKLGLSTQNGSNDVPIRVYFVYSSNAEVTVV